MPPIDHQHQQSIPPPPSSTSALSFASTNTAFSASTTSVASSFSPNSRSALAGVAGRPRSVSASTTTTTSPQQQSISTSPSSSSHPSPQLQSVASPLSSLSKSPSRTPAQFSLQSIFIRFVHAAELKVDALVYSSTSVTDSDLSVPLRSGVDPEFDGLLCGLGSVAKHCPKLIIDCVMVWRKSKSEKSADDVPANIAPVYRSREFEHIIKERKSLVSNFILCRALIEIIRRLTKETLPNDLGHKLEEMVFAQLRNIDPELTLKSANRQANVDLFSELIGTLSNIRFATVSDRFVSEISELTRGGSSKELKLDLIIRSMRFLKLKIYPMECLEETAEFLHICADFFQNSHSARIKLAYAEVFAELLEPIASVAQAEVNLPAWMMSIESIFSKAMRMSAKRVYQHVAIPLITTVLCVSKKEFFLKNWPPLVEICLQKFRDRQLKTMAFNCVTRLVWVYLFRSCDPLSINSQRRIESLLKVLFPVKSRIIVPQDTTLDFFVRLVHIVLVRFTDPILDLLASLLLGLEPPTLNSANSSSSIVSSGTISGFTFGSSPSSSSLSSSAMTESLLVDDTTTKSVMAAVSGTSAGTSSIIIGDSAINPERLIIALRSFLLLLADIEEALKGGISLGGGNMYGALGGGDSNPSPFGAGYTAASVSTVGFVVVEGKVKIPQPPFPLSNLSLSGGIEPLAAMLHRQAAPQDKNPFTPLEIKDSQKPVLNAALSDKILSRMSSSVREYLDRVNAVLGRVAVGLDKVCGQHLWKNVIPANEGGTGGLGIGPGAVGGAAGAMSPGGRRLSFSDSTLGDFRSERSPAMSSDGAAMTSRDKPVLYDLMKNYIDCLPRFTPSGMTGVRIVEMLSRYTLHKDDSVRLASIAALMRVSSIKQGENDEMGGKVFWTLGDKARPGASLLQGVLRILGNTLAIAINDRIATSLVIGESTEGVLRSGGLGLYVDLLELWLKEFKDGKGKGYDEEEVERILCDIEGRGLLYLCSTSVTIRKMGLQIVRLVPAFEKQLSGMTEEAEAEGPASRARSNDGTPELRRRQALYRPSRPSFSSKRAPTIFKTTGNSRLKPQRSRIIQIMEQSGHDLVSRHYLDPTVAVGSMKYESQKYQTQHQQNLLRLLGMKDSLCVIASSSNAQECSIWYRCFPDLVQWFYEYANPKALRICLTDVFARIVALHPSIQVASDFPSSTKLNGNSMRWVTSSPAGSNAALNSGIGTGQGTNGVMPATDNIIDQWKVYLTFACATIEVSRTSGSVMEKSIFGAPNSNRRMGNSDSEELLSKEKALTPGQLFTMMLPLLSCERNSIRQCLVSSLGAVHSLSYKTLLEGLQPLIRNVTEDMRMRPIRTSESSMGGVSAAGKKSTSNQAQVAMISNIKRLERLRVEITHLMSLIADFVVYEVYRSNDALVKPVVTYIRDVAKFLSSSDVKAEWDYQMLRYYYCAMVGRFYERLLNVAESGTGEITKFPASIKPGGNAKGVDAQRIFPYELRASLFLLFEQWCGYGAHAIVFLDRETKTMLSALDPIKDNREKGVIASTMDEQLKVLANAALKAMATLIKGPILPDVEGSIPYSGPEYKVDDIFSWLNDMFRSPDDAIHSVALSAIEALILNNPSREDILEHAVRECYIRAPISPGAIYYFSAIVNVFAGKPEDPVAKNGLAGASRDFPCLAQRMLTLAIYKAGDSNPQVRKGATRLLKSVELRLWGDEFLHEEGEGLSQLMEDNGGSTYEPLAIGSSLPVMYKYAQTMASSRLALERPQFTCEMISEICMRLEHVGANEVANPEGIRDILIFMLPWIRNLNLATLTTNILDTSTAGRSQGDDQTRKNVFLRPPSRFTEALAKCDAILTNLFYLTMKYGDDYISEVENLWIQLVERRSFTQPETSTSLGDDEEDLRTEHHVDIIIDFLLAVGIRRRNPKFVAHAKKVIVYISRTSASDKLVNAIISRITPRSLIPIDASKIFEDADDQPPNRVSPDFYTINLSQILPDMPMRPAFGSGGLACVLLVDLTVELGSAPLLEHLALILHMIFIQLDHFITLVCEQMRLLLINIIQTIIPRKLGGSKIEVVLTKLDLKEGRRIWPYQDLSPSVREIESTKQLAELVADILSLCEIVEPSLSELWANVALSYAVGCPVRHSACRSLQIFRSISPIPNQRIAGELLHRLSSTIADTTEEVQGFALEILITLNTILKPLGRAEIVLIPQFFWSGVSCLNSPLEWEFSEGVLILKKVLSELDLTSQSVRNGLLVNQPTKWRGQFMGVQPLLLRGLFSATTEKDTLDVINLLAEVDNDNLVDTSSSRVLFAVLANLVRLLQAYQPEPLEEGAESVDLNVEECLAVSERLSQLATRTKHMSLARLLSSYSKQRFRAKEDFGRQAVLIIRDTFFPDLEAPTLQFLIGLLRNKLPFYRKRGLQILKLLLPAISSKARPAVGNANGPWGPGWGVGWNSGGATNQSSSKVDWTTAAGSSLMNLEEDLINPLVEMLSSEMAEEALEVLDEVLSGGISFGETSLKVILFGGITMKWITKSVRTTDPNKILAAGKDTGKSDSSKGRSEMPSGWRVTDVSRATKNTRQNIAGVASTCAFAASDRSLKKSKGDGSMDSRLRPHLSSVPRQSSPLARVQTGSAGNELDSPSQSFNSSFSFVPELSLSLTEQSSSNNILEALNDLENYFGFDDDLSEASSPNPTALQGGISSDSIKGLSSDPSIERDYVRSNRSMSLMNPRRATRKDSVSSDSSEVSYSAETLEPPISRDTSLSSLNMEGLSVSVSDAEGDLDDEDGQPQTDDSSLFSASVKPFSPLLDLTLSAQVVSSPQSASLSLPAKGGPGKSLRSSASPLSPKSHASASMRLLSQPFTYVQVVFRVFHANDPDITVFGIATLVEAQVKVALRLGNNEPVLISTFAEPVEKGRGFKITLSVKILENERNEPGKITLMAALAEELVALIHGEGEDRNLQERKLLLNGAFDFDLSVPPEICIDFMGLSVPYVPEDFRFRLPHRKGRSLVYKPAVSQQGSPWIRPDLDSTIIGPNTSFPRVSPQAQSRNISLEAAIDALRIFPSAFELAVQLYVDWLDLVREIQERGPELIADPKAGQVLASMFEAMKGLRGNGQGYSPLLLHEAGHGGTASEADGFDEAALLRTGNRLMELQNEDPKGFNAFLDRREQMMTGINNQISTYLSARQSATIESGFDDEDGPPGTAVVKRCSDLGIALMTLYGMVLGLERLLEEFIGNQEQQQQPRMDESLRCVQIGALLRGISRS